MQQEDEIRFKETHKVDKLKVDTNDSGRIRPYPNMSNASPSSRATKPSTTIQPSTLGLSSAAAMPEENEGISMSTPPAVGPRLVAASARPNAPSLQHRAPSETEVTPLPGAPSETSEQVT